MTDLVIPPQAPYGLDQIVATYGDPKIRIDVHGEWVVDSAWERKYMKTIEHEILPLGRLYVNVVAAEAMLHVFDDWLALQKQDGYVVQRVGCFNPRAQRGSVTRPSTHSWGIAIDLNPDDNKLIICPKDDPRRLDPKNKTIPDTWIAAWRARGFMWGGDFENRFDPMHGQLAKGY